MTETDSDKDSADDAGLMYDLVELLTLAPAMAAMSPRSARNFAAGVVSLRGF
jgi:hypothetical protein